MALSRGCSPPAHLALRAAFGRQRWFAFFPECLTIRAAIQPAAQKPNLIGSQPAPAGMCSGFQFPVSDFFSSPRRCPTSVARVAGEMITHILRLIESLPAVTQRLNATASPHPLALRLKNLMLKTSSFRPQTQFPSYFARQSEFLF